MGDTVSVAGSPESSAGWMHEHRHTTAVEKEYSPKGNSGQTDSTGDRRAARDKGTCTVYAYAHNSVSKLIKVTVK